MAKNNVRSFRFSDEVKEILESFDTAGSMNDNFEQLVLYCYNAVPKRQQQLKDIDKQIEESRKRLRGLLEKFEISQTIISQLQSMQFHVDKFTKQFEKV